MSPLRDALEKALVDDPDDLATHRAYADYLQEQGDPRGEFMSLQLAMEEPQRSETEQRRLHARAQDLLQLHRREWLGGLAGELLAAVENSEENLARPDHPPVEYRFARGWLDSLTLRDASERRWTDLGSKLAQSPEARFLRRLILEYDNGFLDALAASRGLPNLRYLQVGRPLSVDEHASVVDTPALPCLIAKLPRLEELRLFVDGYDAAIIFSLPNLTSLRVLQVYYLATRYPLEVLAGNDSLAHLTQLLLHPQPLVHPLGGPFVSHADVRTLLQSPHLRSLSHLQIHRSDLGNVGCTEIVTSGILKRLKVLDLRYGEIDDSGARTLADCFDLRNLELLDLGRNALTQTGIDVLSRVLGSAVRADNQQTEEELSRHSYLHESEYL
jgi:uncharacterized protein (TIGR02996 family)